jgi:hypothetical protein
MNRAIYAAAAAAVALCAPSAVYAAPVIAGSTIDLTGFFQATGGTNLNQATGLDFVAGASGAASPGTPGVIPTYGSGSGTFAGLFCPTSVAAATCGSITDLTNLAVGPQTINNFLTLVGGNNVSPIIFDLTGITSVGRAEADFLTFRATGNIRYGNFDITPGTFLFSAQGGQATSFSGTLTAGSAVPEPATWAVMMLGFGGLGMTMRRRTKPTMRVRFV